MGWVNTRTLQDHDFFVEKEEYEGSPIAQVPSARYHRDQYSKVSIRWLEWLMEKENREGIVPIYIRHALNEGKYKVPNSNFKLDGYCSETNTAYEFNGCPTCYTDKRRLLVPRTQHTIQELYALTVEKHRYLKSTGMNVVTMWEHEFTKLVQENKEVTDFVTSLDIHERLNPRDAFLRGELTLLNCTKKSKMTKKFII